MRRRVPKRFLSDAYRIDGFRVRRTVRGIFGDSLARVVTLDRRTRRVVCGTCGTVHFTWYDHRRHLVRDLPCGDTRVFVDIELRRVRCMQCAAVRKESIDAVIGSPFVTKRFAFYVGRRCHSATIHDVAKELHLSWRTVKDLDIAYMTAQLERRPPAPPSVLGIDEISIRRGHTYRIVVSDLIRKRPIWFGGEDRKESSMDEFFVWLGEERSKRVRLVVMDMWRPFLNSARRHVPHAAILYDKFHALRHLGDAMDRVRRSEYKRVEGHDRKFIKGQRYTLLAHRENLTTDGRRALNALLRVNRRLNIAYVLKESFGQLWDYTSEAWARRFFDNWCAALVGRELEHFEKFAKMIDRHWDGIAAHCRPENKVSLGFIEGLNGKIRVIQRRAYGITDEEYLRLKILTCTLEPI